MSISMLNNLNAKENIDKQQIIVPFSIQKYMTHLVLPKCVMIHGEVISTVYFQLALNINHQKKAIHWQKNNCWMKPKTLASNTGYNVRSVNNALTILEKLELIIVKQQGKLKLFSLKNNQLKTSQEIITFNNKLNTKLLSTLDDMQVLKYKQQFNKLEEVIDFNSYNTSFGSNIWFSDVNLLRNWIIKCENIYKGSSLFFINNIALKLCLKKGDDLYLLSETNRAIRIGSSQSTISRYINSYINAGCLTIVEENINTPVKLSVNSNFLKEDQNKKRVVIDLMSNDVIKCPICGREFQENRSLSVHISKTKDQKHTLLNHLKKQTKTPSDKLINLYLEYKSDFDEIEDVNSIDEPVQLSKPKSEYLNIPCDCKMSCEECNSCWKEDFYNDCTHERKTAFVKEFEIKSKATTEVVKKETIKKEVAKKEKDYDIVKPVKKVANKDSVPELLKYFYNLTGGVSPNFGKECAQIKNAVKKGTTPDQVRMTMEFLARKVNTDLRFFNRSIEDAILEKQYLDDSSIKGTDAYLVRMYYEGLSLPLNLQTLIRDVQKIKETKNSGLSYEQTMAVVQYMIDIKCPTLNFIGNKRTEALTKATKINTIKENPSFFDRDDIVVIKNELVSGRANLRKLGDNFKPQARIIAKDLFKLNEFSSKYTHFEWAWKIGLDLDEEMYTIALNTKKTQEFMLDKMLKDPSIEVSQRQSIMQIKAKFDIWMNEQAAKFLSTQIN